MRRTQLGIRIDDSVLERLDTCAGEMSRRAQGMEVSRADASRAALMLGLETLEERLGIASPKGGKRPASKPM